MKRKNLLLLVLATFSVCLFVSCGGDDGDAASEAKEAEKVIDTTPITMYPGDMHTIQGADTITSSNQFVALSSKNVVKAWHVGQASLLVNSKVTIPVTVLPKYNLYDGPICKWGCDMDYIRNNQKQGTRDEKTVSGKYVISYTNAGAASGLAYTFENGKLASILAAVSTKYVSQLTDFLLERYYLVPGYEGEKNYFMGTDNTDINAATTVVYMEVYNADVFAIVYAPIDKLKNLTRSGDTDKLAEEAKKLIKEFK